MRGVGAPARRQLQAIAQAIGGKAAKLRVIVPAHIGLPRVATGAAIHADKSGIDRAPIDRVVVRGVHLLLQALPPGQHRTHGGGQLVVPLKFGLAGVQVAVAPGGLPIHELVGRFTDRHGARPDWQKFAFEREPAHFGAHVGVRILGAGAIIHPGFALRLQPLPFDAPVGIQSVAQRHLGGGLLQAIAVGVVAEHILGIGRGNAVLGHTAEVHLVVKTVLLTTQPHGAGCVAVFAQRHLGIGQQWLACALAALGKHLDDPAHGFAAVQGRGRAFDHFNALDQLQRQVGQHRRCRVGRAVAHAIDQQQAVVAARTAQKNTLRLAAPAVAGQLHTGQALQHFGHRAARAHRIQLCAGNDGHIGQSCIQTAFGACGGDHGFLQRSLLRHGGVGEDGTGDGRQ